FASDREFLAALEDQSFQCLLLDVPPPTGAAPGVHRVLLERKTALPVVALVRHADVASAVEAMKTGAVDVIEKPFADHRLIGAVRHAVALYSKAHRNLEQ